MLTRISILLSIALISVVSIGCGKNEAVTLSPQQKRAYELDVKATKTAVAGDYGLAVQYEKQALVADPDNIGIRFSLAKALEGAGKPSEAKSVYMQVVAANRCTPGIDMIPYKKAALAELQQTPRSKD